MKRVTIIDGKEVVTYVLTPEEEAQNAAAEAKRVEAEAHTAAKDAAKLDAVIQYLVTHTPDECAQYVQDNVTDLASAKAFLKKVAKALSVLARRELR
jgi:hypothetical protein